MYFYINCADLQQRSLVEDVLANAGCIPQSGRYNGRPYCAWFTLSSRVTKETWNQCLSSLRQRFPSLNLDSSDIAYLPSFD